MSRWKRMLKELRFFAGGRAAASTQNDPKYPREFTDRGYGFDTPTGPNLPGQPSPAFRMSACRSCGFIAPFSARLACPICEDFPAARDPWLAHPQVLCTWRSSSTWWKPLSWFSGRWVPVHGTIAIEFARDRLLDAIDRLEEAERHHQRMKGSYALLLITLEEEAP